MYPRSFDIVVRDVIQKSGATEANPLKIGNVSFWLDNDSLVHDPSNSQWERERVARDLAVACAKWNVPVTAPGRVVLVVSQNSDGGVSALYVQYVKADGTIETQYPENHYAQNEDGIRAWVKSRKAEGYVEQKYNRAGKLASKRFVEVA